MQGKDKLQFKVIDPIRLRLVRLFRSSSYGTYKEESFGLVSIILPTFNRCEILLSRAIPSVLGQTYKNWELLVISHGCSDSTVIEVEALSKKDPRVKLVEIDRKNLGYPPTAENHWLVGPVKPINAGLKKVSGEWIARIDDDDEWHPNHLRTLLDLLVSTGAEFGSSAYNVILENEMRVIYPQGYPPVGGVQTWLYRSYLKFFRANVNSWQKTWNRVNDTDLQERFISSGVRISSTDSITVSIRPRPGEKQIGSSAYLSNKSHYEKKYGAGS